MLLFLLMIDPLVIHLIITPLLSVFHYLSYLFCLFLLLLFSYRLELIQLRLRCCITIISTFTIKIHQLIPAKLNFFIRVKCILDLLRLITWLFHFNIDVWGGDSCRLLLLRDLPGIILLCIIRFLTLLLWLFAFLAIVCILVWLLRWCLLILLYCWLDPSIISFTNCSFLLHQPFWFYKARCISGYL